MIYIAEKSLRDSGDKVSQEIKNAVNKKIEELKAVKDGEDEAAISERTRELSDELSKIGQSMYHAHNEGEENGSSEQ